MPDQLRAHQRAPSSLALQTPFTTTTAGVCTLRLEHLGADVVGRADGGVRAHHAVAVHAHARAEVGELQVTLSVD